MKKGKGKSVFLRRLSALLLTGVLLLGEPGSMYVSAGEPADVSADEVSEPAGQDGGSSTQEEAADQDAASSDSGQGQPDGSSESAGGQEESGGTSGETGGQDESGVGSESADVQDGSGSASGEEDGQGESGDDLEQEDSLESAEDTIEAFSAATYAEDGTVSLAAPTNLRVYAVGSAWGCVTLYWDYAIDADDTSYSFKVYSSETEDGTYVEHTLDGDTWNVNDETTGKFTGSFGAYVPVSVDSETGNAKQYYFKVKAFHTTTSDGTETTAESDFSNAVQNAGVVRGIGLDTGYQSICFLEDGSPVTALTLHVGETKKLGLGLVKSDGTIVPMKNLNSDIQNEYSYRDWCTGFLSNFDEMSDLTEDSGEYAAVEFSMEEDVLYGYEQYVTANQLLGDKAGTYFLEIYTQCSVYGIHQYRIPITIEAAEDGVTYEKPFTPVVICNSKEEAYAAAREILRSRATGTILVADDVFDQSDIYNAFDPDELYDTFAERDGMAPDEGDYIFYHVGVLDEKTGAVVSVDAYDYDYISAGGSYYDAYTFDGPYLTTRDQEDAVDAKIKELLSEGGDLYAASQYTSEAAKAEAIASYINGYVTYIGTTDPDYHTCYSALIRKTGTCEAYSLLFMRLAREMGLVSKMVGTDLDESRNAHAFDIVKADGKWYWIDALGDCKLHTGSMRTDLSPEPCLDQRFINNYLSKIDGSNYPYVNNGGVTIIDSVDGEYDSEYTSLAAAKEKVIALATTYTDRNYTLQFGGDMSPDADDALDFGDVAERVTVNLGGNTLKIPDDYYLSIRAGTVTSGVITVGNPGTLRIIPLKNRAESVYDYVSVNYKQTGNFIDYSSNWSTVVIENDVGDGAGKICLKDTVTFDSKLGSLRFYSGVEIEGNLEADDIDFSGAVYAIGTVKANTLDIGDDVTVDGDITVKKLRLVDGSGDNDDEASLNGNVTVTEGFFCQDNITVKGNWKLSGYNAFGSSSAPVTVTVEGSLALSGTTAAFYNDGDEYGSYNVDYTGPSTVKLVKKYNAEGTELLSRGELSIFGSLQLPAEEQVDVVFGYDSTKRTIFDIQPVIYYGDEQQESPVFEKGDLIATLSVQEILDGDGTNLGALTSSNLESYITCTTVVEGGILDLDEAFLLVSSECVTVSYGGGS